MKEITIFIRYASEKQSVPTQDDIVLDDLLQQLADRGALPQGKSWVVFKEGKNTAMDLGRTLAENGIVDGDVLDLGLTSMAG
jgi:hypothetical protein